REGSARRIAQADDVQDRGIAGEKQRAGGHGHGHGRDRRHVAIKLLVAPAHFEKRIDGKPRRYRDERRVAAAPGHIGERAAREHDAGVIAWLTTNTRTAGSPAATG